MNRSSVFTELCVKPGKRLRKRCRSPSIPWNFAGSLCLPNRIATDIFSVDQRFKSARIIIQPFFAKIPSPPERRNTDHRHRRRGFCLGCYQCSKSPIPKNIARFCLRELLRIFLCSCAETSQLRQRKSAPVGCTPRPIFPCPHSRR